MYELCREVVSTNRNETTISNIHFTMKLKESFMLPSISWTKPSAAENYNHRIGPLQFRQLPALGGVIGKFVVGENGSWNN